MFQRIFFCRHLKENGPIIIKHENTLYQIITISTSTILPSTILISTSTSAEKHNNKRAYILVTKNIPELVSK